MAGRGPELWNFPVKASIFARLAVLQAQNPLLIYAATPTHVLRRRK
jgi:hypothetical protein